MALPDKPLTRQEMYLSKIAGENTELPEKPLTREEMYLDAIAQGGGGGGTSDFDELSNRPKLNNTAMTGETNITSFSGTDGINAGAQGLVPAPATTDAGKYLKADGTWGQVDAGAIVTLTQADYNYPANNPYTVALWLLPPGMYQRTSNDVQVNVSLYNYLGGREVAVVGKVNSFGTPIYILYGSRNTTDGFTFLDAYLIADGGSVNKSATLAETVDNLTSNSTVAPLSAKQGKVLDQKIATDLANFALNYPESNPDGLAVWTLEDGRYTFKTNNPNHPLKMYWNSNGGPLGPQFNECLCLILDVMRYDEDDYIMYWRASGDLNDSSFTEAGFGTMEGRTLIEDGGCDAVIGDSQTRLDN